MKLFKYETEKEQLEAVKQSGYSIQYIYNPSEEVQLAAVRRNGLAIMYIHNQFEAAQLEAIKQDFCASQYIENPSEKVIRYLLDNYSSDENVMQRLFAKIGEEGYNKLSDEDKLKLELL